MVRGCTKNPLALRRGDDATTSSTEEIVVSDFGARSPSTVDRSGVITCFLKFLLDRLDRRGAKLTRMNDSWDHRPPAQLHELSTALEELSLGLPEGLSRIVRPAKHKRAQDYF